MKKITEFLSSTVMTVVSGVFLAASLVLTLCGVSLPLYLDPAWITVLISGIPLLYEAVESLFCERKITSALLITIAMIASVAIDELFAAGEVAFIMAIGEILEDLTVARAKKGIGKLISLAPTRGRLIADGGERLIDAAQIKRGDLLRILPGEAVPVDGVVVSGDAAIDQSVITGESLPADKSEGSEVYCGTLVSSGSIDITATRVGEDSSLRKMIALVQAAEERKAPMQRMADKWASWLVPAALVIAVITYLITKNIERAVTVLVVFCPCALALATPTAVMAAIGQAAKHGVIIKSGEALERMGRVDCVCFDKTGTLTKGELRVADIIALDGSAESELLALAACAEQRSEHPLGRAIVAAAKEKELKIAEPTEFSMTAGRGVCAVSGGRKVPCGSADYLRENGVELPQSAFERLEKLRGEGKAVILTAADGVAVGMIALSDTLRPESAKSVGELAQAGVKTVLLTGDNARTANYLAERVGIEAENVHAELLPQGKVESIEKLTAQGGTVCMIGDGVNDAPALKTASVGVAMGGAGSDIAVDAADIALMSDGIGRVPYLKRLSNATLRSIGVNITISMAINLVAIVLSVIGVLGPVTGALVHNAGSVLVVLNAALLYDRKYD